MVSLFALMCGCGLIILILLSPLKFEVKDLPAVFSDEPDGVVEPRPDFAQLRNADECFQVRTMRTHITYAVQRKPHECCELFEISYRGKPGPVLEMENDRPLRFGPARSKNQKTIFSLREQRDIAAFVHTVRTIVSRHRALA